MKKSTYSKVLSLVILTAMLLSMLPLASFSAAAETIPEITAIQALDKVIEENSPELAELVSMADDFDIEDTIAKNSPELSSIIEMAEKTQAGTGYGSNGKFLAPIEPPAADSIPISTRAELEAIKLNDRNIKYHLTNDIILSDQWIPIGTTTNSFRGTFDGQGYVIHNLRIIGSNYIYNGLFGNTSSATIKNVGLEDTYIDVYLDSSSVYAGAIYASGNGVTSNCYNTGNITAASSSRSVYVGGIYASGYGETTLCYNTGIITADSLSGSVYAGGIHGYQSSTSNSSISNSYNTGSISASSSSSSSSAGGISGNNSSSVLNCYNTGIISSTANNSAYSGGINASGYHSLSDCYNLGDVISTSSSGSVYAGGIRGYQSNTISSPILSCYNSGDVTAYASTSSSHAGGISGSNISPISNCYSIGNITSDAYNNASAGGIYASGNGSLSNCYNAGNVEAVTTSNSSLAYANAGGIRGYLSNTTGNSVQNCVVLSNQISAENTGRPANIRCYLIGYGGSKANNLALSGILGSAENDADRFISQYEAEQESTYTGLGWDFENVWEMVEGFAYPQLRGLPSGDANYYDVEGFHLSTTKLDLCVGTRSTITLTPAYGVVLDGPPAVSVRQDGEYIEIVESSYDEDRDVYEYVFERVDEGEAKIEFSAYCSKESSGIPGITANTVSQQVIKFAKADTAEGRFIQVNGLFSFKSGDGKVFLLKNHPIYIRKLPE